MSKWPVVQLGELLAKSEDWITLEPDKSYNEVTVRLWGRGVVLRGEVMGAKIAGSRRLRVRSNQFILSRIDARNGATGLIPESLNGAVVTNDFPVYSTKEDRVCPQFLGWLGKTAAFVELCKRASEGTTNRVRLKEARFLSTPIRLPSLAEQVRIVARLDSLASKIERAQGIKKSIATDECLMLSASFSKLIASGTLRPMEEVAPITRRPVKLDMEYLYPEIGIRSFGKGTFHKPALPGIEIGSKKLFFIMPGDLVFSNVFAWEGAVAVVKPGDNGRVGSHRFIACVPKIGVATADFLRFYFLTDEGLKKLGDASPGGAGRNRTLGLEALSAIRVPLPSYEKQLWFDELQAKVHTLRNVQSETSAELAALLPSILDKVFKEEL